ncbi:MAG: MFS transporter [Planctomycetaceae bacterium]|nr:MFS transporter [Planctomycetales bacterium]MCB9875627.1 MFS transporter [Planctomycetaceae bacterium]MCB9939957.1 MFS transporter [Planctomycetaceae bacterium]
MSELQRPIEPNSELHAPATNARFAVTAWLAMAAVFAYLCRNSLVVAESDLRTELGISEEQMGFILGPAFFWTYALAQIPTAWLGERFGSRRCLPAFAAAWSVATASIAFASGFGLLVVSRVGNGIGQAGIFPSSTRTLALWNPQTERASASGILGASMSIGGALGAFLTGWMLGYMPAKYIFAIFAVPGLLWAFGFWWWFRERPEEHPSVNAAECALIAEGSTTTKSSTNKQFDATMWLQLTTSPAAWLICGQQFFRAGGYAFFASWFATYLMETRGVSTAQSGFLTALPLTATVFGSTIGGIASDAVFRATRSLAWSRKGLAGGSLTLCAGLVFSAFFVADPTTAVLIISSGAFLAAFAGPCAYTVTMDMGGNNVASLFSTMNMIGNFGAGLMPWIVPRFKTWIEQTPSLLAQCDGNSWNAVLVLFAVTYLGAAVCWLFLSTSGTVFDQSLIGKPLEYDQKR